MFLGQGRAVHDVGEQCIRVHCARRRNYPAEALFGRIRVQTDEGVIREITPTAVILETNDGMLMVPAKTFAEEKSLLVARGGDA